MNAVFCLANYDWPHCEDSKFINVLKKFFVSAGFTSWPVLVRYSSRKKYRLDLFNLKGTETIVGMEGFDQNAITGNGQSIAVGISYLNDRNADFSSLFLAIQLGSFNNNVRHIKSSIYDLSICGCLGYAIGFSYRSCDSRYPAIDGGSFYAAAVSYGEPDRSYYGELHARSLSKFFNQKIIKPKNNRAYNIDKIRDLYELNVITSVQKKALLSDDYFSARFDEDDFEKLPDGRYLLSLQAEDLPDLRSEMLGSSAVI